LAVDRLLAVLDRDDVVRAFALIRARRPARSVILERIMSFNQQLFRQELRQLINKHISPSSTLDDYVQITTS
jgi:hypothetical protein